MTSLGSSLSLGYSRYAYKGDYGYGDDIDGNPNTDDLRVVDVKFEQISDDIWLSASYIPSYALWASAFIDASRYQFREIGDGAIGPPIKYQRVLEHLLNGLHEVGPIMVMIGSIREVDDVSMLITPIDGQKS